MGAKRLPEGALLFRKHEPTEGRLFVPLDEQTRRWLADRAQGKPLGSVAAEVLRTIARQDHSALTAVDRPPALRAHP